MSRCRSRRTCAESVSYVVPKVDVLLSTIFQYRPGVERSANYTITCPGGVCPADVFQWESPDTRSVSGQAVPRTALANNAPTLTVNLLDEGQLYGEGYTTFDIKVAKVLRFGTTRTNLGVDIYNAFNSDAAIGYVNTYPQQNFAAPDSAVGHGHQHRLASLRALQRAVRLLIRDIRRQAGTADNDKGLPIGRPLLFCTTCG